LLIRFSINKNWGKYSETQAVRDILDIISKGLAISGDGYYTMLDNFNYNAEVYFQ